ncbi:uncharacterized protein LOC143042029 isoform X2 [Mytilus galloprovincialis]|uniref:uncharacterized protein LOC143042029 isoform X2 n=1 Tax=Mytilus galloprovincialis TaxID=29158 RepID=UPI003F7C5E8E
MEDHGLILIWNILVCISTAFTSNISSTFAPPAVEGSSPDASWVIVVILAVFLLAIIIPTGICLGRRRWRAGKNMTTTTKTSK